MDESASVVSVALQLVEADDTIVVSTNNGNFGTSQAQDLKFTNASTDWTFSVSGENVGLVSQAGFLVGLEGVTIHGTVPAGDQFPQFVGNGSVLEFSDITIFVENTDNANIARLYSAALGRPPDAQGLANWESIFTHNIPDAAKAEGFYASLAQTPQSNGLSIAAGFLQSPEFQHLYGSLDDAGFVNALYQNVLGRTASSAELNAWVTDIHAGESREMVLVGFAESAENIAKVAHAGWLLQV
jgi:Domain of unknown function (DUF4214)